MYVRYYIILLLCAHVCTRPYHYYITIMCLMSVGVLHNNMISRLYINVLLYCMVYRFPCTAIVDRSLCKNQNPRQNIGTIAFAACGWFWFAIIIQNKKTASILKYELYPEVPSLVGSYLKPLKSPHHIERTSLMHYFILYRLYNF